MHSHLTFEEYCSDIPDLFFRKEVPEDVVQNFEVIERLLAHSYFEYKFIDEAYSKALVTLEMAMKIRYKDFNPSADHIGLYSLIHSLNQLNLFDTDIQTLMQLKDTRNYFAHPERHSIAGGFYWYKIEFISWVINGLYEDVILRTERKAIAEDFVAFQRENGLYNFIVMQNEGEAVPLFNMRLLWVNNKETPSTYVLAATPLFDLTSLGKCNIKTPVAYEIKAINPIFQNGKITASDFSTGEAFSIFQITKNSNLDSQFQKWKLKYDAIAWKFMYERSLQLPYSLISIPTVRQFYKMG